MKLFSVAFARCVIAATFGLLSCSLPVFAQSTGVVEGRIVNQASGDALGRAQVRIQGTNLEELTNEAGEYRFPQCPRGHGAGVGDI